MRTCSYCGKEHPNEAVRCAIDGGVLVESLPASDVPPLIVAQASKRFTPSGRQLRLIEVVLVCTIALGGSLLRSILLLFQDSLSGAHSSSQWGYGILSEVTSLVLLWYVLVRRSKSFSDLGFVWKRSDIGWSILLCVGGYFVYSATYLAAYYSGFSAIGRGAATSSVSNYLFGGGVTVVTIIFTCINPFFEELIVRAYLITEAKYLTNSTVIAVVVSTIFQLTYHLYQGVPLALAVGANFFLWSLYYAKTNRITPIILAHLYFDVGSTLIYVARH